MTMMRIILFGFVLTACIAQGCSPKHAPEKPHPASRTLSFLHGEWITDLRHETVGEDHADPCGVHERRPLSSEDYFEIDDHKLLILTGLPDYLCTGSNSFVPIVVTFDGKMTRGKRLTGAPSFLIRDPQRTLWLVSQWIIEGTYPMLYCSQNGTDWTEILLPEGRNTDSGFEYLDEICFFQNEIRLRFRDEEEETGHTECWSAPVESIVFNPVWKRLRHEDFESRQCSGTVVTRENWSRKENADDIHFLHPHSQFEIIFPRWL